MRKWFPCIVLLLLLCACGEDDAAMPDYAVVPSGLEEQWKLLPHRFSHLDLRLLPAAGAKGWRLTVRNDGGPWGAIDNTSFRLDYRVASAVGLSMKHGEVKIRIPAGASSASQKVTVTGPPAAASSAPVLRGLLLSTYDYAAPPPCKDSYDPAHGFTSSGLGVRLRNASFSGGVATFTAEVNNSLSPCDRFDASKKDDMNGAMKKADTWITVAYSVLFLPAGSTVTPGSGQHSLSYAEYGVAAPAVKQPALAERTVTIKGKPGASQALVGLQGFDFISNSSSKLVAGCTVKQLADCKGTGRYIRTVRARASLGSMDKTTGEAKVELDLMFANKTSSGMGAIEKGSMCVQASGDVVLIQLPDGARVSAGKKAELKEIKSGVQGEAAVDVCGVLPGGVDCP